MAQTILFKDSFDGASGALIASRSAVVGSWESGGFSLTGAGAAESSNGIATSSAINPPPSAPSLLRISCEFSSDLSEGGTFWVSIYGDDYNLVADTGIYQSGSGLVAYVGTSADFTEATVAHLEPSNTLVVELGDAGIVASLNGEVALSSPPEIGLLGAPDFRVVVGCYTATTVFDVAMVADPEEDTTGTNATATADSPLGVAAAKSDVHASGNAQAPSPLTPAVVRAVMGGRALSSAPTMLGTPFVMANHDFTVALGDVTARYLMDLVTPGGLVRAPISSWQATLQTGGKCYVQAVIPASTQYADAINSASEFVISRAAVLPSGMTVEQEMARAPVSAQFDRGSMRETCTISGYSDGFAESTNPPAEYDRTLANIRSMSSGAGGMRVRCAVDWLLRPGQRAFANGVPMIADYINYYAPTGGDSYMDVGERA